MKLIITAADKSEEKLFYSSGRLEYETACVGHLRMDFDTGRSFHSTWFVHNNNAKTLDFVSDLQDVINELREKILKSRRDMQNFIGSNDSLFLGENTCGFKVETDDYVYFLRCKPQAEEYDCYCYCYDKELLELALTDEETESNDEELELNLT